MNNNFFDTLSIISIIVLACILYLLILLQNLHLDCIVDTEKETVSSRRRNSIVSKKEQYRLEGDASKQIRSGHLSANSRIKAIITLLPRPVKVPANNAPKRESLGEGDSWEESPTTGKQIDGTWEFEVLELAQTKTRSQSLKLKIRMLAKLNETCCVLKLFYQHVNQNSTL